MAKAFIVACALLLAGCAGMPQREVTKSACAASEASYPCQVERYQTLP